MTATHLILLKNQRYDYKTSTSLFGFLTTITLLSVLLLLTILSPQMATAQVFIPSDEYLGYFDANEIYTVVGNIKNESDFAVLPTVTVTVIDDTQTFSRTIIHVPIPSGAEIPFKIKFPTVSSKSPTLTDAEISFERTIADKIPIDVLYDKTLHLHADGHITGRIQNSGNHTIYYPKIFAVVHGHDAVLDIAQNIEFIEKIDPGQIVEFSMYPDPSITDDVFYYSCFGPVDTTVVPITTRKNDGDFNFRYDSGAWYSRATFDETGTVMTVKGYNSFAIETYANFEIPPISGNEEFSVTLNDEPIDFIQSIDELGFWHIAFTVEPTSQHTLKISGFEKGLPPELSNIPAWVKLNAYWWATDQISDIEFLEGIDYLFEKAVIYVSQKSIVQESQWIVPQWVKQSSEWWYDEKITDEEFLLLIEYLVEQKIILV